MLLDFFHGLQDLVFVIQIFDEWVEHRSQPQGVADYSFQLVFGDSFPEAGLRNDSDDIDLIVVVH